MATRRQLAAAALATGIVAAATIGVVTVLADTGIAGAKQAPPRSSFDLDRARAIAAFPVYYAGDRVEGHSLTAVLRRTGSADYVSFVYGDCIVESDTGCAPPAEIQVWPACTRNLSLYDATASGAPAPESTSLRGVPAAFFEDGRRLELQTGRATVVIFAASRSASMRIASALRGINSAVAANVQLPSPADGAVEGRLRC